jgi:hypothetical protein
VLSDGIESADGDTFDGYEWRFTTASPKFMPSFSTSATSVRRGHLIRLDIVVAPSSKSRYRPVSIQRWDGSRWVTFRTTRLWSRGTATVYIGYYYPTSRRVRVYIGAYGGYGAAASAYRTLRWR